MIVCDVIYTDIEMSIFIILILEFPENELIEITKLMIMVDDICWQFKVALDEINVVCFFMIKIWVKNDIIFRNW